MRAAFNEAVGVDRDLALSHWLSPGKSVWVGKARLGGSGFLALVGPFGGFRRRRQTFGADVNFDEGAFGDAGRVDAFDLPMAEGAGQDGDEIELVVVREMAEVADEILNRGRQIVALRCAAGGKGG